MIALDGITKGYGNRTLFRDVTLRIGDDERVALVGPNGAGKSTLLKIILGLEEADAGLVVRSRSSTAGWLPQEGITHAGRTLADEAATAFDDLLALHGRVEEIAREIDALSASGRGASAEVRELAGELGRVQHHLEHREGYAIRSRVEEVLLGLGFRAPDLDRPTGEFSGGWQMRLALAKLLLREPTLLMLDEPTNHLDIESLEWLEDYLRGYDGSVLLISHDRRFLDNLARRTLELSGGKLTEYRGNYSRYLEEKAARMEILRSQYQNQQEKVRAAMEFVDRFRYKATKARQVQSRLKAIEKLDLMEQEEDAGGIDFDFPEPPRPGRVLLRLEGVGKSYGDLEVLRGVDLSVERGDRIAFLGVNGAGKSTLARIVAGTEPFDRGSRTVGHNVVVSSYAQHQAEALDPGRTVLETLEAVAPTGTVPRLRTLLGCFLFPGDDVFKRVGILSGGEKSRLALAKMLLLPANLLVLDEPTNHLDLRSKAVLQAALERFGGAVVIVSHDRDFLAPLAHKVLEFRDRGVRLHLGTVDDYLEELKRERREAGKAPASEGPERAGAARADRERKRAEAEERQERYRKEKPLREAIARQEERISLAEGRRGELETLLARHDVCADPARVRDLSREYREVTASLGGLYDEWTRLQEDIERL